MVILAAFLALLAALGPLFDALIGSKGRQRIYHLTYEWWDWLDEHPLPRLHPTVAAWGLALAHLVRGRRWLSLRAASIVIAVSVPLTLLCVVIGDAAQEWARSGFHAGLREAIYIITSPPIGRLGMFLLVNLACDTATFGVTVAILHKIRGAPSARAMLLIVIDLLVALMLAAACVWIAKTHPFTLSNLSAVEYWRSFDLLFTGDAPGHHTTYQGISWGIRLFASTTLVPTLAYGGLLIACILARSSLDLGRHLGLFSLAKAIDDSEKVGPKFRPFTLLAVACAAGAALVTLVIVVQAYCASTQPDMPSSRS